MIERLPEGAFDMYVSPATQLALGGIVALEMEHVAHCLVPDGDCEIGSLLLALAEQMRQKAVAEMAAGHLVATAGNPVKTVLEGGAGPDLIEGILRAEVAASIYACLVGGVEEEAEESRGN